MRKAIPEFQGEYEADIFGNIFNSRTGNAVSQRGDGRGYLCCTLFKNGNRHTRKAHRLIASTFLPIIPGKTCVNHKDLNRKNNKISNLEWCTPKENVEHAIENGAYARGRCGYGYIATDIKTKERIYFKTAVEAENKGFDSSTIAKCCKGERKKHKGFTWSYENRRRAV